MQGGRLSSETKQGETSQILIMKALKAREEKPWWRQFQLFSTPEPPREIKTECVRAHAGVHAVHTVLHVVQGNARHLCGIE